jgi:SP family sugar:H+ symporter-like MFS transporter
MTVSQFLNKFKPRAEQTEHEHTEDSPAFSPSDSPSLKENGQQYDDSPVAYLTWRSFILGILASMGGFIFGYSTGTSGPQEKKSKNRRE